MAEPTSFYNLRGPSPVVWAMRTRFAAPPPPPAFLSHPPPLPLPSPPPLAGSQPEKRKRGRPRKYGNPPPPPPGFGPDPGPDGKRVRSLCGSPPSVLGQLGACGNGLVPHVLTFEVGEDIASKIMLFSQQRARAICILSAHGAVLKATVLQPSSSSGTLTHEGLFEIIRLSGSCLSSDDDGCLSVSLACPDGGVIGGRIAGPLIAAMPVQAIVGSFHYDGYRAKKKTRVSQALGSHSKAATGNASNASCAHSNQDVAFCTTVEQPDSSQMDVKLSLVVA